MNLVKNGRRAPAFVWLRLVIATVLAATLCVPTLPAYAEEGVSSEQANGATSGVSKDSSGQDKAPALTTEGGKSTPAIPSTKASSASYMLLKSDGFLYPCDSSGNQTDTTWISNGNSTGPFEATKLFVDSDVKSISSRVSFYAYSGFYGSTKKFTITIGGNHMNGLSDPGLFFTTLVFKLKNGVNQCASIEEGAFSYRRLSKNKLTTIVNMDKTKIRYIDNKAFYNCTALRSVTLPDTCVELGDYAFQGCSSLTSIKFGKKFRYLGLGTFKNCSSLKSVKFPNSFKNSAQASDRLSSSKATTNMGWMDTFDGCTSLSSITMPGLRGINQLSGADVTSEYYFWALKDTPFTATSSGKENNAWIYVPSNEVDILKMSISVKEYSAVQQGELSYSINSSSYHNVAGHVRAISGTKGWVRLWGSKALDTMQQIARCYGTAKTAVVATNASYKDTLAATALAGSLGAPLLTTAKDSLSEQTKTEIKRMGVKTVYIVGSDSDVSSNVERQIKYVNWSMNIIRVSGNSASAKAIACAKKTKNRSDTVIIATQNNFKDALSISSYAYASKSPVLYAETNKKLSSATVNYIKSAKFKKAIIVGGPVALPKSIETQLKSAGIPASKVTRLAGSNEYKTSRIVVLWATGSLKNGTGGGSGLYKYASIKFQPNVKLGVNKVGVARADDNKIGWKDALAGAALCGKNKSVLLLADKKNHAEATAFLKGKKSDFSVGYVFGGTAAVPKAVFTQLSTAIG